MLTVADVARYPRPGTAIPSRIAYAPDGRALTYLFSPGGDLVRDLWRLDLATGRTERAFERPGEGVTEQNVSREEALRRERQRLRETGVTDYVWAEAAPVMLVPLGGELYARSRAAGRWRWSPSGAVDPKPSRDGRRVFFVRDGELWCVDGRRRARRLTSGAEPRLTNGLAEYIAQEEMGRAEGYWWSPDGRRIAYQETDERHIPLYPIVHQGEDAWSRSRSTAIRSPGRPTRGSGSAIVAARRRRDHAGSTSARTTDVYLARVDWDGPTARSSCRS